MEPVSGYPELDWADAVGFSSLDGQIGKSRRFILQVQCSLFVGKLYDDVYKGSCDVVSEGDSALDGNCGATDALDDSREVVGLKAATDEEVGSGEVAVVMSDCLDNGRDNDVVESVGVV